MQTKPFPNATTPTSSPSVSSTYLALIRPHQPINGIADAKQIYLITTSFSNDLFAGQTFSKNAPHKPVFTDAVLVLAEGAAVLSDYPKFAGQLTKRAANHAAFYLLPLDWAALFSEGTYHFLNAADHAIKAKERPLAVRTYFSEALFCAEAAQDSANVLNVALYLYNFEKKIRTGFLYTGAELEAFPLLSERTDKLYEVSKTLYTLGVSFQRQGRTDLAVQAFDLALDGQLPPTIHMAAKNKRTELGREV